MRKKITETIVLSTRPFWMDFFKKITGERLDKLQRIAS